MGRDHKHSAQPVVCHRLPHGSGRCGDRHWHLQPVQCGDGGPNSATGARPLQAAPLRHAHPEGRTFTHAGDRCAGGTARSGVLHLQRDHPGQHQQLWFQRGRRFGGGFELRAVLLLCHRGVQRGGYQLRGAELRSREYGQSQKNIPDLHGVRHSFLCLAQLGVRRMVRLFPRTVHGFPDGEGFRHDQDADRADVPRTGMSLRDPGVSTARHGPVDAPDPADGLRNMCPAHRLGLHRLSGLGRFPCVDVRLSCLLDHHRHNGHDRLPYHIPQNPAEIINGLMLN